MNKIRRINLFAGPGAGKSVVAAQIFAELKKLNLNIEHVQEAIKILAIQNRPPESFDQFHMFAKQLNREDRLLRHINYIVTDSPLLLNAAYSKKYKCPFWAECLEVALQFEDKYPSLNIFLDRKDLVYDQFGRYGDLEEALKMDKNIIDILTQNSVSFKTIKTNDFSKILITIKNILCIGV